MLWVCGFIGSLAQPLRIVRASRPIRRVMSRCCCSTRGSRFEQLHAACIASDRSILVRCETRVIRLICHRGHVFVCVRSGAPRRTAESGHRRSFLSAVSERECTRRRDPALDMAFVARLEGTCTRARIEALRVSLELSTEQFQVEVCIIMAPLRPLALRSNGNAALPRRTR